MGHIELMGLMGIILSRPQALNYAISSGDQGISPDRRILAASLACEALPPGNRVSAVVYYG